MWRIDGIEGAEEEWVVGQFQYPNGFLEAWRTDGRCCFPAE